MWGIFISRKTLDTWEFRSDSKVIPVIYYKWPLPILHSVRYCILTPQIRIVNAERIESPEILRRYFPWSDAPRYCPEHVTSVEFKSIECQKWMRFEATFFIQRLIPTRPVNQYITFVKERRFEHLVYHFGGVNPLVLKEYLSLDDPLIHECAFIYSFTELMKKKNVVWMNQEECSACLIQKSSFEHIAKALVGKSLLKLRETEVALAWAADQEEAFVSKGDYSLIHEPGRFPEKLSAVSSRTITVDFTMASDVFIDNRQVSTSMLRRGSNSSANVQPFKKQVDAFAFIRTELDAHKTKEVITFTELGNIDFETTSRTCVFSTSTERKLVNVTENYLNMATSYVSGIATPNEIVFEKAECVSSVPFQRIPELIPLDPKVVVAIFTSKDEFRWISWLDTLNAKKILVSIGI